MSGFRWLLVAFVFSPFVAFALYLLWLVCSIAGWWCVPVLAWIAAAAYITPPPRPGSFKRMP